ncbi:hypothetical protein [Olleya aquimaris]|uniref:Uncharacterized protein n=1 Tax=Olleya aquimaris TaxID=639310 RepID=A0A327R7L8_9FLAO|nr:hypothetical protein [Olleya aquimaris]RAJ12108.1 hypothetical protein LY08_02360 [Olleya aquimaris]
MKNVSLISFVLLTLLFATSCETEKVNSNAVSNFETANPNFRVTSGNASISNYRATYDDPCMTTNLIAGQHHIAGTVTVDFDGQDLIITYATNQDWSIEGTHLSIGNCDDRSIPTTGSGNPKIGHFEHSTTHSQDVSTVSYYIDASVLSENYCFAAHAEVNGPTGGETAWAEGLDFDGNNWAMYVEGLLSDCNIDDDGSDR